MTRKLFALALGRCSAESADSLSNQEILLGGHLYLNVLKVVGRGRERGFKVLKFRSIVLLFPPFPGEVEWILAELKSLFISPASFWWSLVMDHFFPSI